MMIEVKKHLRPYQIEAGRAILTSVYEHKGLTFTVEIARQGGKNELSAQLELWLLFDHVDKNENLIKCSPTFKPQTINSMIRLEETLTAEGLGGQYSKEKGYMIRLGNCRAIFLSAEDGSNVVGNTAHLLLEVDEAQDVGEEKYTKEFKPMGLTTNVTNVLYGTTWDDSTLLEKMKQSNLELERQDGIRRHFRYDWQEIGKYNEFYLQAAEEERRRLGEDHPLFRTQYRLLPVHGGGGFLSAAQKAQLQGTHTRLHHPSELQTPDSKLYIAGIDLAGEEETDQADFLKNKGPQRDAVVMTIGELSFPSLLEEPALAETQKGLGEAPHQLAAIKRQTIKIIEHYTWTGQKHPELYPQLIDLLKNVWHCRSIAVDSTGIGEPAASFLHQALGARVVPFKFTAQSKTELGFNLLAAINSGGLKMYAADNSAECQEFWRQIERAKSYFRSTQTMNFFVDPAKGHDDFLMSLALLVEAGRRYEPREARGR